MNDLRYAIRQLRKHPFTNGVIVLTIALLIGAMSVIYASIRDENARLAPFPESERMVKLWRVGSKRVEPLFPADLLHDYAHHLRSFEALGAIASGTSLTLTEVGEPASYYTVMVSPNLLHIARVTPIKGRIFGAEDASGDNHSILISEKLWREKLGADDRVLGHELRFNDTPYTVVGVLPDSMRNTRLAVGVDLWIPKRFDPSRTGVNLWVFGRLKSGVSKARAQAELDAVTPALESNHAPDRYERTVAPDGFISTRVVPLDEPLRRSSASIPMELIFVWVFGGTIITSVVGIACFNVTNLLLTRVVARSRELGIRQALGAGRGHIVRHVLAETVLLSILGGSVGLLVSVWLQDVMRLEHANVRLDWRLYVMSVGGTLLLGILVGLLPAFQSARVDVTSALKEGHQTVGGRRRHGLRNFLVASEVTMALILCMVAGLLTRGYLLLQGGSLGFDPAREVAFKVRLREDTYPKESDRNSYLERALIALRNVPGVEAASMTMRSSLIGYSLHDEVVVEGAVKEPIPVKTSVHYVSCDYATISGRRLLRGRDLSTDAVQARNEALVNESFVRQYLPSIDPLGRHFRLDRKLSGSEWVAIVGVVRNRHPATTYEELQPEVLMGHRRGTMTPSCIFLVQTRADARPMSHSIRVALRSMDANQPVNPPMFMTDLLKLRNEEPRKAMTMLGSMAGVGLFIAVMGVYSIVAFAVKERTREVGIRMAVGASRMQVLLLVMWQGARLILMGAIPGLLMGAGILALVPFQGMFSGVGVFDLVTHLGVVLVVGATGILASILPARKAANLNPVEALRYE